MGTRYESRNRTISYTYANVNEAVEKIEDYVLDAKTQIRNQVKTIVSIPALRQELTACAVGMFDTGDDNFDVDDILLPVQNAVNRITIPHVTLDADAHIDTIRSSFSSSEVRDSQIEALRKEQARVVALVLKDIIKEVSTTLDEIKTKMTAIQDNFIPELTRDLEEETKRLSLQLKEKQKFMARYEKALALVEKAGMEG